MSTLHTFGCSITQGFALPDTIRPITDQEEQALGRPFHWTDVHLYQPSEHAWPAVLGRKLGMPVQNHARRGACFRQIARQCAVYQPEIKPEDTVIVMWTYMSRISLQWPARTTVPFCNIVDPNWGWQTVILGFNRFFGLEPAKNTTADKDRDTERFIERVTKDCYLDPRSQYDQYYNNLVLQTITDGHLRSSGARVLHFSVEPERSLDQLAAVRNQLDPSLREPYVIPNPQDWYKIHVDHDLCMHLHDPSIPPAANDQHPSIQHHLNFADAVYSRYFGE